MGINIILDELIMLNIGIVGIGVVGGAMMKSFINKGYVVGENLFLYDKYNEKYVGPCPEGVFENLKKIDIIFVAVPTEFNYVSCKYDMLPVEEVMRKLRDYGGLIVMKCTVEPGAIIRLCNIHNLHIVHNPEFCSARTAVEDFENQKHIIIGLADNHEYGGRVNVLIKFYKLYYGGVITVCRSAESELVKLTMNSFGAVKVQFFTELYLLCGKLGVDYGVLRDIIIKNDYIHPMHTTIPGPDGSISYGGACFPKDSNALLNCFIKNDVTCDVLKATINERNIMRSKI